MQNYEIVVRRVKDNHWQVWWNDDLVFEAKGDDAQDKARCFADGLEQGITGSKKKLYGNSRIIYEGWYSYLEAFDTYEDYRG